MITVEKNENATFPPLPRERASAPPPQPSPQRQRVIARERESVSRRASGTARASVSAAPIEEVRKRPMARKGLKPVRRAQEFGWRSPEAAGVVVASIVVGLACFYVAAYARVAAEGFEAARVRGEMKDESVKKEALEAEIARLTLPATVKARAIQLGMEQASSQTVRVVTPAPQAASDQSK